ncbi:MAG TPA: hypothetical protein VIT43_10770 [Candidatus Dormibacteraeota bacterium]
MRLELLCELRLRYRSDFLLLRPYGGEQGAGYGEVDGTVVGGRLRGRFQGVNHPRRRNDRAMLPAVEGAIKTDDGSDILFSFAGRTVWVDTPAGRQGRQLLGVLFEAEDERYRWLNDTYCVLEGKISPEPPHEMQARIYSCVSEMA